MKSLLATLMIVLFASASAFAADSPIAMQGFEKMRTAPKLWVVNMPNENALIKLTDEQAQQGKQSLKLSYHFTAVGQYLGVTVPLKAKAPIQKINYQMRGDSSGCGYGIYILDASGETHKYRGGKVDFDGWKQMTVDLTGSHETWGGDKNGKINVPLKSVVFEIATPGNELTSDLYFDDITVESDRPAVEVLGVEIAVNSPEYCADIKGDTTINVTAAGLKSLTVKCWQQGAGKDARFGKVSTVTEVQLDANGNGSFVFPADKYPHGPITLTISGARGDTTDNCYLQLYNTGGVSWNEGAPAAPPAAKGLKLVFADDFDGPLSIGNGSQFRYYDHKPLNGSTDFSFPCRFTNHDSPNTPFAQVDTYLRIRADENKGTAGLLSTLHNDGSGFRIKVPAYFECRFIGPNAPGSWPAFWLMTDHTSPGAPKNSDELDIIEAYGGEGPGHPNAGPLYMITPHVWAYPEDEEAKARAMLKKQWPYPNPVNMHKLGIPSTWYEAPHTYACLVTETETSYYCDDILIGKHDTLPLSKTEPIFPMVNLATGGGWPVDLSRYAGTIDMYIDYIRVYGLPQNIVKVSAPAATTTTTTTPAPKPADTAKPAAVTTPSAPAAQTGKPSDTIVNGSFENPALGPGRFTYTPENSNWTFSGMAGIQSNGSAYSGSTAAAPDGTQTAFLQGAAGAGDLGAMQQTVTLTAGTYTLAVKAAQRWQQQQPVQVSVDGEKVGAITPASGEFDTYTVPFKVKGGDHEIKLEATDGTADKSTFIDQVDIKKGTVRAGKSQ